MALELLQRSFGRNIAVRKYTFARLALLTNALQVGEPALINNQTGNQKSAPKKSKALIVFQTAPRQTAEFLISINEFFYS